MSKTDLNIISLSFGSLGLSGSPCGRAGENAGEVVVVRVVCRMWPRTKRNVVEARELFKDVGRAVLGLPKEPQPPKYVNERGCFFNLG